MWIFIGIVVYTTVIIIGTLKFSQHNSKKAAAINAATTSVAAKVESTINKKTS